jgi:hypothetical protein
MTDYAFKIGQMVDYRPTPRLTSAVPGPYQIVQRMPPEDGEFKYRIKSPREPHERVAMESDLRSAAPA